jgi:hypothetical protein
VFSFPYELEKPSKNDTSRLGNNGIFHFFDVKKAICDRTIYEGTALKTDFTRERKVIERVVKGLFYHEFQRPHPNDNSISVYSTRHRDDGTEGLNSVLELINFIKPENKKTIGNEVFSYG